MGTGYETGYVVYYDVYNVYLSWYIKKQSVSSSPVWHRCTLHL